MLYESIKCDLFAATKKEGGIGAILRAALLVAGFRAALLYRMANKAYHSNHRITSALLVRLMRATCGIDIEVACEIGPGVCFPHPLAIVIGGKVSVGRDCKIMQGVSLGGSLGKTAPDGRTQPKIGDNVFLGAGAKILGPVIVGDNAIVGANAVVVKDVPQGAKAFGVPAKIISEKGAALC